MDIYLINIGEIKDDKDLNTSCKNKLMLDQLCMNITPAQVVKHVLKNPVMEPEKFKKELGYGSRNNG